MCAHMVDHMGTSHEGLDERNIVGGREDYDGQKAHTTAYVLVVSTLPLSCSPTHCDSITTLRKSQANLFH